MAGFKIRIFPVILLFGSIFIFYFFGFTSLAMADEFWACAPNSNPCIGDMWANNRPNAIGGTPHTTNVGIGTQVPAYKLHVVGDIYANEGWLRSSGNTGWYNESFCGGWWMADPTWIRSYCGKSVYIDNSLSVAGNIGIGTTTPGARLDVRGLVGINGTGGGNNWLNFWSLDDADHPAIMYSTTRSLRFGTWSAYNGGNWSEKMRIDPNGNLGVGTGTPQLRLDVRGGQTVLGSDKTEIWHHNPYGDAIGEPTIFTGRLEVGAFANGGANNVPAILRIHQWGSGAVEFYKPPGQTLILRETPGCPGCWYNKFAIMDSNVGIGTTEPTTKLHVVGDVTVTGNIAAKYQDVAEWVPASRPLSAGMVVVLDTHHSNQVLASIGAYDTRVAGVVTDMPGILLGEAGDGKVKVATTGRVKVKVDATNRPVHVGDLIVTSDKEGIAMISEPLDLGGVPIHRPGTLIGKAPEPLKQGEGEILVLLSLQ